MIRVLAHILFILNIITHPVFLPILLMWWYFYSANHHYPMSYAAFMPAKLKYEMVSLFVSLLTVMPMVILFLARVLRLISDITLSDIKERRYFFLFAGVYYWMIFYAIKDIYFHDFIRPSVLLIGSMSVSSFVLSLLNFSQFKISLHAAGYGVLAGFFAGCGILFNDVYVHEIIFSILAGAGVMIIRLLSGAHNSNELLAGWASGWFSSLFVFWTTYQYS